MTVNGLEVVQVTGDCQACSLQSYSQVLPGLSIVWKRCVDSWVASVVPEG